MIDLVLLGNDGPHAEHSHNEEQDQRYDSEYKNRHNDPQRDRLCCRGEHKSVMPITGRRDLGSS